MVRYRSKGPRGLHVSGARGQITSLGFWEMTFPLFWDLNEIKHAKYLTRGLTHNMISINMCCSSLSCVTLLLYVWPLSPRRLNSAIWTYLVGGLGTMLEGRKKSVFISPAPPLWASVLARAAFLFLWPSSSPEDPLP